MALIYRGESITKDNPKLELFTYSSNMVVDVIEARFRIFDISSAASRAIFYNPAVTELELQSIQEFPATPGDFAIVDHVNLADNPTLPGHKLGVGHYFAEWTAPEDASPGSYSIHWEYRFPGDTVGVYRKSLLEFVVAAANFFIPEQNIGDDIREHMRDYAFKNELVDGFESTDAEIQRAINLTIKRYNMMAPRVVIYKVDNFPEDACYVVIMGAVAHLLRSISLQQLRNQLTYTDGGVHVGLTDKHQLYKAIGNEMMAEFDRMSKDDKITRNIDSGWGIVHSPYHGYYTFYGV